MEPDKTQTLQKVEGKLEKNRGACHIYSIFILLGVQNKLKYPLQNKT
jgi:hypothetical protein